MYIWKIFPTTTCPLPAGNTPDYYCAAAVSKVVLVGGASRVPKIQTNLQRTVAALGNQAQVKKTVDLDRGIAMGELLSNICTKETWSL
jgi:molecular chaperone DnaK (HSP70)